MNAYFFVFWEKYEILHPWKIIVFHSGYYNFRTPSSILTNFISKSFYLISAFQRMSNYGDGMRIFWAMLVWSNRSYGLEHPFIKGWWATQGSTPGKSSRTKIVPLIIYYQKNTQDLKICLYLEIEPPFCILCTLCHTIPVHNGCFEWAITTTQCQQANKMYLRFT